MNWFKKAQQGLLFLPWEQHSQVEKINPIGFDDENNPIYRCNMCKNTIKETDEEIVWILKEDTSHQQYDIKFNIENIKKGMEAIYNYLYPIYNKFKNDIKQMDQESSGWWERTIRLERMEYQTPQLPAIINQNQSLKDVSLYKVKEWYNTNHLFSLISNPPLEIKGSFLSNIDSFMENPQTEINRLIEDIEYDKTKISIKTKVPLCENCQGELNKCDICSKPIPLNAKQYKSVDEMNIFCQDCLDEGKVETCLDCGLADYLDSMQYIEDSGRMICELCINKRTNQSIQWAEETIKKINIPTGSSLPFSKKELNILHDFTKKYIDKYGNKIFDEKEWGRFNYLAKKARLPEICFEYLQGFANIKKERGEEGNIFFASTSVLLEELSNVVSAQNYIEKKYPNIKNYIDVPYEIDVTQSYKQGIPGFSITITPSQDFFEYAQNKFKDIDINDAWNKISNTPHHPGTLAYARCGFDGEKLVINNLQRDADYDYLMTGRVSLLHRNKLSEFVRWMDKATKYWDVFLIDIIKAICMAGDIKGYITTFDQQKRKWGLLPIHKAKKTYEKVPELMDLDLEDHKAEHLTEDGVSMDEEMYRVAKLISQFKRGLKKIK